MQLYHVLVAPSAHLIARDKGAPHLTLRSCARRSARTGSPKLQSRPRDGVHTRSVIDGTPAVGAPGCNSHPESLTSAATLILDVVVHGPD